MIGFIKKETGVTLLEVLIASVLAVTVFVGAGYLFISSQKMAMYTNQYNMLTEVAQFYIKTTEYQYYLEESELEGDEKNQILPYTHSTLNPSTNYWEVLVDWDEEHDDADYNAEVSLNRNDRRIIIDYDSDQEWDKKLSLKEVITEVFSQGSPPPGGESGEDIAKEIKITVTDPELPLKVRPQVTLSLMLFKHYSVFYK